MKYIIISILTVATLSCKAQNIVAMYDGDDYSTPFPIYYKDADNDFNPYIGEWKWIDGNNSLTIVFDKRVMLPESNGNAYNDHLIGAYKYVVNGVELVNTYPIDLITNDTFENHLNDMYITTTIKGYMPPCPECPTDVRYITLSVTDPTAPGLWGKACMVYFEDNGVEKIRIRIWNRYNENLTAEYDGPMVLTIPEWSVYTLTKQN